MALDLYRSTALAFLDKLTRQADNARQGLATLPEDQHGEMLTFYVGAFRDVCVHLALLADRLTVLTVDEMGELVSRLAETLGGDADGN
jgi:hypothetical protein